MIALSASSVVPGGSVGPSWSPSAIHLVDGLEPGPAVARAMHDALGLDVPWAHRDGRGFVRRVDGFVQRIWWEAVQTAGDAPAWQVRAETEVVRDIRDIAAAAGTVSALNGLCSMGALVVDPARGSIIHRTGAWVRGDGSAVAHRLGIAAGLQASEVAGVASVLATTTGGAVAWSRHRGLEAHPTSDGVRFVDQVASSAGRSASRWRDGGILRARRALASGPAARLGALNDRSLSMLVPFAGAVAELDASTMDDHPILGHGLRVRLVLPASVGAAAVGELQRAGVEWTCPADLMGSWLVAADRVRHTAFYPDAAHAGPDDVTELLRGEVLRAAWAAEVLG